MRHTAHKNAPPFDKLDIYICIVQKTGGIILSMQSDFCERFRQTNVAILFLHRTSIEVKLLKMPSVGAERTAGETRICYSLEHNGVYYSMRVTAAGALVESVTVSDVARDFETAKRLLDLFADNLVFPISVYEILDDLFADGFFG